MVKIIKNGDCTMRLADINKVQVCGKKSDIEFTITGIERFSLEGDFIPCMKEIESISLTINNYPAINIYDVYNTFPYTSPKDEDEELINFLDHWIEKVDHYENKMAEIMSTLSKSTGYNPNIYFNTINDSTIRILKIDERYKMDINIDDMDQAMLELLKEQDKDLKKFLGNIVRNNKVKLFNQENERISIGGNPYIFQQVNYRQNEYFDLRRVRENFKNVILSSPSDRIFDNDGKTPEKSILDSVISKINIIG